MVVMVCGFVDGFVCFGGTCCLYIQYAVKLSGYAISVSESPLWHSDSPPAHSQPSRLHCGTVIHLQHTTNLVDSTVAQ